MGMFKRLRDGRGWTFVLLWTICGVAPQTWASNKCDSYQSSDLDLYLQVRDPLGNVEVFEPGAVVTGVHGMQITLMRAAPTSAPIAVSVATSHGLIDLTEDGRLDMERVSAWRVVDPDNAMDLGCVRFRFVEGNETISIAWTIK